MTETPKDKRAAALERIKALSSRRSTTNRGGGTNAKNPAGGGQPKQGPKHGGVGHRPQGG